MLLKSGLMVCGEKAFFALQSLPLDLLPNIFSVIAAKDPGVTHDYYDEIKQWAEGVNIPFKDRVDKSPLSRNPEVWIALGWKWVVPITDNYRIITFHDSLLPKHRGFNPLVTSLIEGDHFIGATVIWATDEIDEGPILFQESFPVSYPFRISQAIAKMGELYGQLLKKVLEKLQNLGQGTYQSEMEATYSLWRDEDDYWIDWSWPADRILRQIHASDSPYLGVQTLFQGEKIKIWDAELIPDLTFSNRVPGKIWKIKNNEPQIVCGSGMLRLENCTYPSGELVQFKKLRCRLSSPFSG